MKAICILTLALGLLATLLLPSRGDAQGTVPAGFRVDILAVGMGSVEDFTFDAGGDLLVGSVDGKITRVSFGPSTPLPIDGSALSPEVTGNHAVYGLAFDGNGDLWLSEWDNGEITKLDYPLPVVPYDASVESPVATLSIPDGVSFAPSGSPFGTDLYVGDIQAEVVSTVAGDGTAAVFADLGYDIEGVAFGPAGDVLYAWSPGGGRIWAVQPDGTATVLASGFAFPDAAAPGPGNEFGDYVYVGDLTGNTLYRVDPDTGATAVFATFAPDFSGFEDIVFGPDGNMYILGFGRGGQILRVEPAPPFPEGGIERDYLECAASSADVDTTGDGVLDTNVPDLAYSGPVAVLRSDPGDGNPRADQLGPPGEPDGHEDIATEIVSMELTGVSALFGPLTIRAGSDFGLPSLGAIEEQAPGTGFPADSFFDLIQELTGTPYGPLTAGPDRFQATINAIPAFGDVFGAAGDIEFRDAGGTPRIVLHQGECTPLFPVGGIAEFQPVPDAPADESAPSSANGWAAAMAVVAGAVVALAGGGWYVRRRFRQRQI